MRHYDSNYANNMPERWDEPDESPMSDEKHTPTPWRDVDSEDCTHVAFLDDEFGESQAMGAADYRHALKCVNSHDELLSACRLALDWVPNGTPGGEATRIKIRAAIAKATQD